MVAGASNEHTRPAVPPPPRLDHGAVASSVPEITHRRRCRARRAVCHLETTHWAHGSPRLGGGTRSHEGLLHPPRATHGYFSDRSAVAIRPRSGRPPSEREELGGLSAVRGATQRNSGPVDRNRSAVLRMLATARGSRVGDQSHRALPRLGFKTTRALPRTVLTRRVHGTDAWSARLQYPRSSSQTVSEYSLNSRRAFDRKKLAYPAACDSLRLSRRGMAEHGSRRRFTAPGAHRAVAGRGPSRPDSTRDAEAIRLSARKQRSADGLQTRQARGPLCRLPAFRARYFVTIRHVPHRRSQLWTPDTRTSGRQVRSLLSRSGRISMSH